MSLEADATRVVVTERRSFSGSAVAAAADLGIPLVVLALLGARGDAAGVGDEEPPTRRS
jgi:hypothetical protein